MSVKACRSGSAGRSICVFDLGKTNKKLLVFDEDLRIVEERMPPNAHEERHHHSRARQFFYVLSGTLTIELDGREHTVSAGSGLHVPAGTPHLVANRAQDAATFLAIASPTTAGDRHVT